MVPSFRKHTSGRMEKLCRLTFKILYTYVTYHYILYPFSNNVSVYCSYVILFCQKHLASWSIVMDVNKVKLLQNDFELELPSPWTSYSSFYVINGRTGQSVRMFTMNFNFYLRCSSLESSECLVWLILFYSFVYFIRTIFGGPLQLMSGYCKTAPGIHNWKCGRYLDSSSVLCVTVRFSHCIQTWHSTHLITVSFHECCGELKNRTTPDAKRWMTKCFGAN